MPGSATIGTNLVDSLLGVVDDLRSSLHADMGVRQWRVYTVRRVWATEVGDGSFMDTLVEITPSPLVSYDLVNELTPAGLDERGNVRLSEVSLTYTEDELLGRPLGALEQWYYLLRDAHGQGLADRYFGVSGPPKPDRISTIGWVVQLVRQNVEGC
jgi:hypothetical protein